jgi:hypothetical protein
MFDLLLEELKISILNVYLKKSDACVMRISNKNILSDINFIFEEKINYGRGKETCLKISNIFDNSYYMNNVGINIIWEVPLESICICKKNGDKLILKKDDIISFYHRESGVKITNFTGHADKPGPIGLEYLPWRGNRWASPIITLRGNPRHIIAYPTGMPHYGEHIKWYSVNKINLIT